MLKVAINGFGRIGRSAFKIAVDKFSKDLEIVAINDLGDAKTLPGMIMNGAIHIDWLNR